MSWPSPGGAGSDPGSCSESSAAGTAQVRTHRMASLGGQDTPPGQPGGSGSSSAPPTQNTGVLFGGCYPGVQPGSPWSAEGPGGDPSG